MENKMEKWGKKYVYFPFNIKQTNFYYPAETN